MYINNITSLLLSALAVLIALSLHEAAHAYAAYKLGDSTAKNLGRLTINPLSHLDPMGALCMLFFHFGWAKPVPINARNFKNPRRDFAITALAGPLANIVTAFFVTFIYLVCEKYFPVTKSQYINNVFLSTLLFLYLFSSINVGLGVFNLIPIPPFDGSRILNIILPTKLYFKVMKYEKQIYWFVIAWLLLGGFVYRGLLSIPFIRGNNILAGISKIFSLSDLIAEAVEFIYLGMIKFWKLLPFLK